MKYEITPCIDDDAEFIVKKADEVFDSIAPAEEGAEEEVYYYKVTDEDNNLLGGIILVIDERKTAIMCDLWVEEPFRGRGIASALLREAELKARELGCYLVLIGTFDFEAKPLYDKHGYELIEKMTDYPKGHEHYFLQKRLDRPFEGYVPSNSGEYEVMPADEEDAEFISRKLSEYEEACAPREHDSIPISKKVTEEDGRIIAGIVGGVTGWNNTEIEALWVDEPYRGQGIGSALLSEFEREAKNSGAYIISIEPYDWDVEFYKKNGFDKVTGVLKDYPKGHTMYCMDKYL